MPCMCGDTQCPSCGRAQGTYEEPDEAVCDECGHPVVRHDAKEGCTFERGDSYESGFAPMALGPCGCTEITLEIEGGDNGESREWMSGPGLLGRNL